MAKVSTSYKKGQSGNPKGRPKADWTWSGLLKEVAEEQVKLKDGSVQTKKRLVAESLYRESLKGNVQATKIMMDRMDGMPMQQSDFTTKGDKINIVLTESKIDPEDG